MNNLRFFIFKLFKISRKSSKRNYQIIRYRCPVRVLIEFQEDTQDLTISGVSHKSLDFDRHRSRESRKHLDAVRGWKRN